MLSTDACTADYGIAELEAPCHRKAFTVSRCRSYCCSCGYW
jgi:hypothetical protein